MSNWQLIKKEIDAEVKLTNLEPVADVTEVFKYGLSKNGAGIPDDNQIFTTWFFGGGDVSYLADWCYFLVNLSKKEEFTMPQLVKMMRFWVIQPSEFGNYCGLCKQWDFAKEINGVLDSLDKEAFCQLLDSFRGYLSNINVWVYHYMPWGVGAAFPVKDAAYFEEGLKLLGSK